MGRGTHDQLLLVEKKGGNKGDQFLNKLWCCVGGGVKQENSVLSTKLTW